MAGGKNIKRIEQKKDASVSTEEARRRQGHIVSRRPATRPAPASSGSQDDTSDDQAGASDYEDEYEKLLRVTSPEFLLASSRGGEELNPGEVLDENAGGGLEAGCACGEGGLFLQNSIPNTSSTAAVRGEVDRNEATMDEGKPKIDPTGGEEKNRSGREAASRPVSSSFLSGITSSSAVLQPGRTRTTFPHEHHDHTSRLDCIRSCASRTTRGAARQLGRKNIDGEQEQDGTPVLNLVSPTPKSKWSTRTSEQSAQRGGTEKKSQDDFQDIVLGPAVLDSSVEELESMLMV